MAWLLSYCTYIITPVLFATVCHCAGPRELRRIWGVPDVQVLLGRWRGTPVAVKVLKASAQADAPTLADFQTEAEMLCRLRHPNILDFFGACQTANTVRLANAEGSNPSQCCWKAPVPED